MKNITVRMYPVFNKCSFIKSPSFEIPAMLLGAQTGFGYSRAQGVLMYKLSEVYSLLLVETNKTIHGLL